VRTASAAVLHTNWLLLKKWVKDTARGDIHSHLSRYDVVNEGIHVIVSRMRSGKPCGALEAVRMASDQLQVEPRQKVHAYTASATREQWRVEGNKLAIE